MKILVPVDGSLASFNAAKKSAEIAKRHDAAVVLLITVIDSGIARQYRNEKLWRQVDGSIISGNARTVNNEELDAEIRQNATELLDSLEEDLDFGDAKIEKFVLTGEPYHLILDTANGVKADLIVMGNRGFSKIKRFFTGSVTQRVISEAPCPVLVIHTDAED